MLNQQYINNIVKRIENTNTCAELAKINAEVLEFFTKLENDVLQKISTYANLIISPTDLASAISWINKLIATFTGPYNQALAMQTQLVAAQAAIYAAVTAKMSSLTCPLFLLNDLGTAMKIPKFGVAINGVSLYGGG
jgi:hypothetical protein